MIPELAQFALVVALITALVQTVFPLVGAHRRIGSWITIARPAAYTQFLFIGFAYACLTYSFITYDFSVAYVAQNSNSELPLMYRISGVWGAHEGSLLLWVTILSAWTATVAFFSRNIPADMIARVLGVMGLISIGFLSFLLFTSNPFVRWIPAPSDGNDLNPLLQDPGMAIHPPHAVYGVRRVQCRVRLLSGRHDQRSAGHGVGKMDKTMDNRRLVIPDCRNYAWIMVGIL